MPDAPDSTSKVTPPFSPLRVQIEPPEKRRRREKMAKRPQKRKKGKGEKDPDLGKAIDVLI
jgi:hypothetical protein